MVSTIVKSKVRYRNIFILARQQYKERKNVNNFFLFTQTKHNNKFSPTTHEIFHFKINLKIEKF